MKVELKDETTNLEITTIDKICDRPQRSTFQCDQCSKALKTKGNLRRHKYNVHGPKKICSICKKSFYLAYQLKLHVASVHDKIRPVLVNCSVFQKVPKIIVTE